MKHVKPFLTSALNKGDLHQQLHALSLGQKLKLTVDTVDDSGAVFKSDDMTGATIVASKDHVTGRSLIPHFD